MARIAVILFNLGGPDNQAAVKPFLFNLFYDPAIIKLPNPFRFLLAKFISKMREKKAQAIYAGIGGGSPILPLTMDQAKVLEAELSGDNDAEYKVFISMRYWHPLSSETISEVKKYRPDKIILLPLYPQFSTTTTGSSFSDWAREAKKQGLACETKRICCYFAEPDFIEAHVELLRENYNAAEKLAIEKVLPKPRILFSAHGLPESIIAAGDPYQFQIEETVKAVITNLDKLGADYRICYQSRVGPKKWLGPSLGAAIEETARDKTPLVVVPISFVSEHSETLYELDIQYKTIAEKLGAPGYFRVPALGINKHYIKSLAELIRRALMSPEETCSFAGVRPCPLKFSGCANRH